MALLAPLAPGDVIRFPEQLLVDGSRVPAHASVSGEASDAAAARRREQLQASPYGRIGGERILLDGAVSVSFDAEVPVETVERVAGGYLAAASQLFERDGWSRPHSVKDPLQIILTAGPQELPAVAAWERREVGRLVGPVVAVPARNRTADAVLFDAIRQVAILSLRQTAAEESGWCVEALAEWLARSVTGLTAEPMPVTDPMLAEAGSLSDPLAAAAFLGFTAWRLPGRTADVRAGWDEAGAARGDDSEAFLRQLAARADARGLPALLSDYLAMRLQAAGRRTERRGSLVEAADIAGGAPVPFGWRRISFRTGEDRGGLEITLPDHGAVAAGRAVIFYRGRAGEFDVAALEPGRTRTVPLSGTAELDLVLVDGSDAPDFYVRLRRAPDYPAALSASGVEWREGGARISWRTSSHRDLLAWVVTRYEETAEGVLVERGREIVPTAVASDDGFDYELTDRDAGRPGGSSGVARRLRYRVYALTTEGLLSEAFDAALPAR